MIHFGFALVHFSFLSPLLFSLLHLNLCNAQNHISPSIAFFLGLVIVLLIIIFLFKKFISNWKLFLISSFLKKFHLF